MDQLLTDGQSTISGGKEVAHIRCSFDDPTYDRTQKRGWILGDRNFLPLKGE